MQKREDQQTGFWQGNCLQLEAHRRARFVLTPELILMRWISKDAPFSSLSSDIRRLAEMQIGIGAMMSQPHKLAKEGKWKR